MDTTPYTAHALPPELKKFRFLTEQQVSLLTGRALQTLRNDRFKGQGFPYVKLFRSVRYPLAGVLETINRLCINPEAAE